MAYAAVQGLDYFRNPGLLTRTSANTYYSISHIVQHKKYATRISRIIQPHRFTTATLRYCSRPKK
jgi:hypothetical protein